MSELGSSFPDQCDNCDASLGEDMRYPTTTVDGTNGDIRIFTFCSEECREGWVDERDAEPNRG